MGAALGGCLLGEPETACGLLLIRQQSSPNEQHSALDRRPFPVARMRVLAALLVQTETRFHLRELARISRSDSGTLGRELDKHAKSGLLL